MLLSAYSVVENPVFELVDVMVFVDKSMIGAFVMLLLLLTIAAVAVVDVGDGELDDALYGNVAGCTKKFLRFNLLHKFCLSFHLLDRMIDRSALDRSVHCLFHQVLSSL